MKKLFPTSRQWKRWSLTAKLTAIGTLFGLVSIILSISFEVSPHLTFNKEKFENEFHPIFNENNKGQLNIIFIKFNRFRDLSGFNEDYESQIISRISDFNQSNYSRIKIHFLKDSIIYFNNPDEAIRYSNKNNADIIIWGSAEESNLDEYKTDSIRIQYALTSNLNNIDTSLAIGDTGNEAFTSLTDLRANGYLQNNLDYVVRWIIGYKKYYFGNFLGAIQDFEQLMNDSLLFTYDIETIERIGDLYRQLGKFRDAFTYHKRVREIIKSQRQVDTVNLNINSTYLSLTAFELGMIDSANYFLKTINEKASSVNPDEKSYFYSVFYMAATLSRLGRNYEALNLLNSLIVSYPNLTEVSKLDLGALYNGMGVMHLQLDNYRHSEFYFKKVKNIFRLENTDSLDAKYGTLEANMGELRRRQCKYESALQHVKKAKYIYEKHLDSNDVKLALINNNLAIIYFNIEDFSNAIQYYNISLINLAKSEDINKLYLGMIKSNIAMCYLKLNSDSIAFEYSVKGISDLESTLGNDPHQFLTYAYNNHSKILLNDNNRDLSAKFILEAIEMAKDNNYPRLALFYANAAKVYFKINRDLASKYKNLAFNEFRRRHINNDCLYNKIKAITKNI